MLCGHKHQGWRAGLRHTVLLKRVYPFGVSAKHARAVQFFPRLEISWRSYAGPTKEAYKLMRNILSYASTRHTPRTVLLLLSLLLSVSAAQAQSTAFTYQGRLTDGGA